MPSGRKPEEERKENFNIRIQKKLILEMKKIKGYNRIIEELIAKYLKDRK